jgi:hypothetical protein
MAPVNSILHFYFKIETNRKKQCGQAGGCRITGPWFGRTINLALPAPEPETFA